MNRLALILALLLAACQSAPPRVVTHVEAHEFVQPDVKPVIVHVHDAAASNTRAVSEIAGAAAAALEAAMSAKKIVEEGTAAHSAEGALLAAQITATQAALFRAQAELRDTSDKLARAEAAGTVLEKKVAEQAGQLNTVEAARVAAVNHGADLSGELVAEKQAHREDSEKKDAATAHQTRLAWKWRLATFGLTAVFGLFVFRRPLGALCGIPIP